MENSITIEATTYVVTRHFSDGEYRKQDLLLSFLAQKLAEAERVDHGEDHEI